MNWGKLHRFIQYLPSKTAIRIVGDDIMTVVAEETLYEVRLHAETPAVPEWDEAEVYIEVRCEGRDLGPLPVCEARYRVTTNDPEPVLELHHTFWAVVVRPTDVILRVNAKEEVT